MQLLVSCAGRTSSALSSSQDGVHTDFMPVCSSEAFERFLGVSKGELAYTVETSRSGRRMCVVRGWNILFE